MLTDIEIARNAEIKPIKEIANKIGINEDELEYYGKYKAKVNDECIKRVSDRKNGKLILVTAINPTPAGEGKTTTSVGLGDALSKLGKKTVIALREPSLGPVFGIKGGAAGGGYAQVLPMEDINLHFTGDIHAMTAANNLLCAMIDNHIKSGNELNIDVDNFVFPRVLDINDRALRKVIVGLGGRLNGYPREDSFTITVASEIMAIMCLATSISDLKKRLGNIIIGFNKKGEPLYARQIKADGALTVLLKDARLPNLVQTIEGTPAFIHCGPFANIAHGCNSVTATSLALKLSDYTVTEAGFGSDLGAEKFLDIKCRVAGLKPSCVVLVATVRALKYNGGIKKEELQSENLEALKAGSANLKAHISNLKKYGIPVVVAINRFGSDTDAELDYIKSVCEENGVRFSLSEVFAKGGEGGLELGKEVIDACNEDNDFKFIYDSCDTVQNKIETIAKEIYHAGKVIYSKKALGDIAALDKMSDDVKNYPVCIAKTQYSFSDDQTMLGDPRGYDFHIQGLKVCGGAGFIVAYAGDIMTMPGLPKSPAAERIDIDDDGIITGLF